ncbi:MAG TPA: phosphatase PAP2 family protein [Actinomycetota bacterium]|nr:phosphatase PAP2 family protein [Actinomycetota bacterium]
MLRRHRRAFLWSVVLLVAATGTLFLVGRHPSEPGTVTTVAAIGRLDLAVYEGVERIRVAPLTWLFRALNVIGGGIVTIPLRAIVLGVLAARRRWHASIAFALTWLSAEIALWSLKRWFDRARPPDELVATVGASFPSGHALAGAATAVALVLAFFLPAPERRRWEWIAVGFAFVMAFSRVYLHAHWLSDVIAGVLLGSGIAIFWFAALTEIRHAAVRTTDQATRSDATAGT